MSAPVATYDTMGSVLVATLAAGVLSAPEAERLSADITTRLLATQGVRHVILDIQNVHYMDSMCIGVLVELMTRLDKTGGRIALVRPSGNVEYLFKLTRLDKVFGAHRDVMSAIRSLERAAA